MRIIQGRADARGASYTPKKLRQVPLGVDIFRLVGPFWTVTCRIINFIASVDTTRSEKFLQGGRYADGAGVEGGVGMPLYKCAAAVRGCPLSHSHLSF